MSVYLTIFSKLRYLGLVEINDNLENNVENCQNNVKNGENGENGENCKKCEKCVKNCDKYVNKYAILNTMRGLEPGILCGKLTPEQQERYRKFCLEENSEQLRGPEPMLQNVEFVRMATHDDLEDYFKCRRDEERALVLAREIMLEHNLSMKLVDVEYILDRKKLFFYFTSDQRVDFRAYVRDLAREFRTRIEMRQIGVRDEARAVKGTASCGRPCCCSYWLHHFTPICMKMVKEQKLALNPMKISGLCGRLMCCLAYEHANYEALWDMLPPPGTRIKSGDDFYVIDGVDLGSESVNIKFPSGSVVPVPIKDFENFNAIVTSGGEWGVETEKEQPTFAERRRRRDVLRPRFAAQSGGIDTDKPEAGGLEGADVNNVVNHEKNIDKNNVNINKNGNKNINKINKKELKNNIKATKKADNYKKIKNKNKNRRGDA